MMSSTATTQAKKVVRTQKIVCPKCDNDFGFLLHVGRIAYLNDGVMNVRVGWRSCSACGTQFHWHGEEHDLPV